LFERFRTKAQQIRCEKCSPNRICDGSSDDDEIVANRGQCLLYFRELFDYAVACTENAYRKYATRISDPLPQIVFGTNFLNNKPQGSPTDCYVSGKTSFDRDGVKEVSKVEFYTDLENFGEKCLNSSAYVFFHECVAHAYRSLKLRTNPLEIAEKDDPFDEGWMDLCACLMLQKVIKTEMQASSRTEDWKEYIDAAWAYHRARALIEGKLDTEIQIALGVKTAQEVINFLEFLLDDDELAETAFFRLSFDVNLSDLTRTERREFVVRCFSLFCPPLVEHDEEKYDGSVIKIFSDYLQNGSVRELLSSLSDISRPVAY
jgi:hypothetical protein